MTDFLDISPIKYTKILKFSWICINMKKILCTLETLCTHCDICFAKMGVGLCPAAAEHPLLCVQKNQEYHQFLM